jgi:dipeptidyl aminopeptidase/acylaminoacyl peptidase
MPVPTLRRPAGQPWRALLVGAATLALAPFHSLVAQGRAFTPADWYRLSTVSQPAMSPDGKRVAFTVTTVNERDNRRHQEVWLVGTEPGAEPRRLTAPAFENSQPRWSPDGKVLYFSSNRTGGQGNAWAFRMDEPGEAVQLPAPPSGDSPKDRSFVVFTAAAGGEPGAAPGGRGGGRGGPPMTGAPGAGSVPAIARAPFDAVTKPLDPTRFDGMHITAQRYKANGQGFLPSPAAPAPAPRPQQIFTQALDGSPRRQLTDAPYSHRNVRVSPDGKWIAFTADARLRPDSLVRAETDSLAKLPYDREREEAPRNVDDIYVMPVAGGAPRKVAQLMGTESALAWSPDSKKLAFALSESRTSNSKLMVIEVSGGAPKDLLGGWRYEAGSFDWRGNNDLTYTATIGGRSALLTVDTRNGRTRELLGGRRVLSGFSWDDDQRRVAYVSTSVTRPTELFLADADGRNERQLTRFNAALNDEIAWSDAERITYPSVGGLEIEGWLMKPHGYQPGTRYPVVLYIHGGPHSQYNEGWFDEFQNLAGAGMFVLYTNPRGSSGYGADFTYSTRGRWFAEDYQDLMTAVDLVAQRPDVDSTRMGVTGGSYGGVMTAWVTVKTQRFKAAQADRMISNWWSWYGTSDAQGLTEFEFYGTPWDNPVMYDTLSPIRYASKVRTPTFILQSEEDHRTPMTDAAQWFLALKKFDVPVEFVRYPRSTHDLSRNGEPWLLVDRLHRLRLWFGHWLAEGGPPAVGNAGAR